MHRAPQPQLPEASDTTSTDGSRSIQTLTPFQPAIKFLHHWRSDRNSRFKRMWWWGRGAEPAKDQRNKSSIRRRNDRPGLTTLQAWFRLPTRDSSSLLVHTFRSLHSLNIPFKRSNFSDGRRRKPRWYLFRYPKT